MPLDAATVLSLAAACAPKVAASTLLALVTVESGLDPLAIGVNGAGRKPPPPADQRSAVRTAERLMAAGASVDLGLAQINSRNLPGLGLSVAEAFEPCANLRAAAQLLSAGFLRAQAAGGSSQRRLRVALSYYNTGHPGRGFANGYVGKVVRAAGVTTAGVAAPRPAAHPGPAFVMSPDASQPRPSFVFDVSPADRP